eukprot:2903832-Amphidinium_carterae.1
MSPSRASAMQPIEEASKVDNTAEKSKRANGWHHALQWCRFTGLVRGATKIALKTLGCCVPTHHVDEQNYFVVDPFQPHSLVRTILQTGKQTVTLQGALVQRRDGTHSQQSWSDQSCRTSP